MNISEHPNISVYGKIDGTQVHRIHLDNGILDCSVLTYGCILASLSVPDSRGGMTDVVLGYDSLEQYAESSGRMGAVIGRYANRIKGGRFDLDHQPVQLSLNRGPDHIHGGFRGFDKRVWKISGCSDAYVELSYISNDGEEGYPGNMDVRARYELIGPSLRISYRAVSDRDTVCNLTNHSYFNLSGGNGIGDHRITIRSGSYFEADSDGIPTGRIREASGDTDLRGSRCLGGDSRYDLCYLLDPGDGCAVCRSDTTGIAMSVSTDMPAMQFYTADNLSDRIGKNGMPMGRHSGICFETQYPPDAPNHPEFGYRPLRKGEVYDHYTTFSFSVRAGSDATPAYLLERVRRRRDQEEGRPQGHRLETRLQHHARYPIQSSYSGYALPVAVQSPMGLNARSGRYRPSSNPTVVSVQ